MIADPIQRIENEKNTNPDTSLERTYFDCSPFVKWDEEPLESAEEKVVIFQSLVATMKLYPVFDASLEAKTVKFLESMVQDDMKSTHTFLGSLASISDESYSNFMQSVQVLLSSSNQAITSTTMKMLRNLIMNGSNRIILTLVKANLIPQLINTLNPLSLSFAEAEDIHTCLNSVLYHTVWLATPSNIANIGIEDPDEQKDVHETVLKQILVPSEQYVRHLCVNHYSIVDTIIQTDLMTHLATILEIFPYYQPTMDFVLSLPVFLTIPSCLASFETDRSIWNFLEFMTMPQKELSETRGTEHQIWRNIHRMLRMEGIEDGQGPEKDLIDQTFIDQT
ncbi:hypothetical protein BLNAU_5115 [Blattamonas nauphoetae]|uniref:Uncharacterized protein n=1 Tax=Blattamonas nauphoetae TaxID=2049346 RepID=A0ABQ9Y8A2_9EUKA|nr:hypothetical protein BLNAU_5115 [Blattamonas nauphoetae]